VKVSAEAIKALREKTGAGIMECKRALLEVEGNAEAAAEKLIERGYEIAKKKEHRVARQGLVESYVHAGGRIAALVELNCESDFVARTPEFKELAHDMAMQVVATCPKYLSPEDVPAGEEFEEEDCLLLQPFIRDPGKQVQDIITEVIAKVRENVRIRKFLRFELGVDGQDEQPEL